MYNVNVALHSRCFVMLVARRQMAEDAHFQWPLTTYMYVKKRCNMYRAQTHKHTKHMLPKHLQCVFVVASCFMSLFWSNLLAFFPFIWFNRLVCIYCMCVRMFARKYVLHSTIAIGGRDWLDSNFMSLAVTAFIALCYDPTAKHEWKWWTIEGESE